MGRCRLHSLGEPRAGVGGGPLLCRAGTCFLLQASLREQILFYDLSKGQSHIQALFQTESMSRYLSFLDYASSQKLSVFRFLLIFLGRNSFRTVQ